MVSVAVAFVVLSHEAERVRIFQHGVHADGRAEADVILLLVVAIVDDGSRVLAHAGPEGIAHALCATRECQAVFLLETRLMEQLLGAVKVIVLRICHVKA